MSAQHEAMLADSVEFYDRLADRNRSRGLWSLLFWLPLAVAYTVWQYTLTGRDEHSTFHWTLFVAGCVFAVWYPAFGIINLVDARRYRREAAKFELRLVRHQIAREQDRARQ